MGEYGLWSTEGDGGMSFVFTTTKSITTFTIDPGVPVVSATSLLATGLRGVVGEIGVVGEMCSVEVKNTGNNIRGRGVENRI